MTLSFPLGNVSSQCTEKVKILLLNIKNGYRLCEMFTIVKAERKIFNSEIETIADLWIRGTGTSMYFLCPTGLTWKFFCGAVQNRFQPISSWQKIKCQVLESKFSKNKMFLNPDAVVVVLCYY